VKRGLLGRLDERGLKLVLAVFFLALAIPSVVLVAQAYSQLKWGAFRSTQLVAEELATRIDATLRAAIAAEDARSFGDYSFLVVQGDVAANFTQRSPLSAFPVASELPGVLGYFQVDAAGRLTTPLLPDTGVAASSYGVGDDEQAAREARAAEVRDLLARNRLVRPRDELASTAERVQAPAERDDGAASITESLRDAAPSAAAPAAGAVAPATPTIEGQAAFDRFRGAENEEFREVGNRAAEPPSARAARLDTAAQNAPADERQKRLEQTLEPAVAAAEQNAANIAGAGAGADADAKLEAGVRMFESEVDPFEVGILDTGHLVLFRNVWRDGERYIQGALVDREAFIEAVVAEPFRASSAAGVSSLSVVLKGGTIETLAVEKDTYVSAPELVGEWLHRARLSPPFGAFELAFAVDVLPAAPGTALLAWVAVTLAVVLIGGFWLMYRFAMGQMRLARQQQDFVSAVSHELKTPLTSIRMYGEMLKAGWADEDKKRVYYEYIHSESERLSRLIENVLQLARLTRNSQRFDFKPVTVAELVDMVRSKVGSQVERAGFKLELRNDAPEDAALTVDLDAFAQVFINLVDNALKFAAGAANKVVEIASRRESDGGVLFTVRDFGPGVPKGQMKKIFELFYRPADELTRETVGTGIGLALVRQLATAMDARVDVRNREPGAEFRVHFASTQRTE
jgi:signal transduction histidine kinase